MMNCLDINNKQFDHHYQKVPIVKQLKKYFGEIYLGGKKTITTDELFIIINIRTDCQTDTAEFEGFLNTILSEESLNNHRIYIKV